MNTMSYRPQSSMPANLLAGDIGGTKINLAVFDGENGRLIKRFMQTFHSREHNRLEDFLSVFLGDAPPVLCASTSSG